MIEEFKEFQLIQRGKREVRFDCGSVEKSIGFLIKNHAKKLPNAELKVSFIK